MSVESQQAARDVAERNLFTVLRTFEKETGLAVRELEVVRVCTSTIDGGQATLLAGVVLRAELPKTVRNS
jgi:hypothetical protein